MQGFYFETIDSTNEAAKNLIRDGAIRSRNFVVADEQTAGKGQRGCTWISPKDAGIYLSVVDFPGQATFSSATLVTLSAGVACVEMIQEKTGVTVQLKPVNDLYVNGCKLGGILTETMMQQGSIEALITGIGININKADRNLPDAKVKPICLEDLFDADRFEKLDTNVMVAALVHRVLKWNQIVWAGEVDRVHKKWEEYKIPGATWPTDL